MTGQHLHDVLEATGFILNGQPADGVCLGEKASHKHETRDFVPDGWWQGESDLTVYFKYEPEIPSDNEVARWRQAIWNKGFAPLLWVVSPIRVDLYNGFGRPQMAQDAIVHRLATFETIERDLDRLDEYAGRLAMETGQFWEKASAVNRKTSVDRQLLRDLAYLERDLTDNGLDRGNAQGLIGRSIFTQYLIDRGIVTIDRLESDYGHSTLAEILQDRFAAERLFAWLREAFNGDMFPAEASCLPDSRHLGRVADFLNAVDPVSGQMTLFPYQFDVIPVELISSIYEQFAHSDPSSESTRSDSDVFYTRLSLVSLVLDELSIGLTGTDTVLDLACGSGIFLVEALRRLVALRSGAGEPSRETIRSVLHSQIYGVDISEPAVRVAAFSLYLAALELESETQPPEDLKFEPLIGKTLLVGDAWNVEETPEGSTVLTENDSPKTFDLIVGNPPWSYPGQAARLVRIATTVGSGISSPRGVSLEFVNQAMRFASETTRFGMVLSAVQFFTRSVTGANAVRHLIRELSPLVLVNLSYQTGWLFPRGNLPAMVLFGRHRPSDRPGITTVQVPWSPAGAQTHTFHISPEDVRTLPLTPWESRPELLKAVFFGLHRDLALLDRLTDQHAALGDRLADFGTGVRSGLTAGNRSRDSRFLYDLPMVTKGDIKPFIVQSNLALYNDEGAQWPRRRDNYRAPLVIIREFLRSSGRPVAAVSDRDVVFTDTFFGVSMSTERQEFAQLLTAILNSSFASWYFLMTASTFGISMPRLLIGDVEALPMPDLEAATQSEAGRRLIYTARELLQRTPTANDWRRLDEEVFDLYDLDMHERIVARDGLLRSQWQWKLGRIQSVSPAQIVPHILAYANAFVATLEVWLSVANRHCIRAEVIDLPISDPLRVVRFVVEDRSSGSLVQVVRPEGNLREVLKRIGERMNIQISRVLNGQRSLRVYRSDEVVIIKPAARRFWMEVSALEDADDVIADSIAGDF